MCVTVYAQVYVCGWVCECYVIVCVCIHECVYVHV